MKYLTMLLLGLAVCSCSTTAVAKTPVATAPTEPKALWICQVYSQQTGNVLTITFQDEMTVKERDDQVQIYANKFHNTKEGAGDDLYVGCVDQATLPVPTPSESPKSLIQPGV